MIKSIKGKSAKDQDELSEYLNEDEATRIASNSKDIDQFDNVTRFSLIRNDFVIGSQDKYHILNFLIELTDHHQAFHYVETIKIRKLYKNSKWTLIEWYFSKSHDVKHRKVLARTLIHIALALWKKFKVIILYPDAIQMFNGHRSTDCNFKDYTINTD